MRTVDQFIAELLGVKTPGELFQLFHAAMLEEGYENSAFLRIHKQRMSEILWFAEPEGFSRTYLAEGLERYDPVVKRIEGLRGYVHWDDVEERFGLDAREREVVEVCRELGVYSGVSYAFRSPDGRCEMFDVSMRQKECPDRGRLELVRAKLAQVHNRYWDMVACEAPIADCNTVVHMCGSARMTASHCRALVLTEIAARRWELDLTELNLRLLDFAGAREIGDLLSWGLISEQSDEERFKFYYAPTAIGQYHLRTCYLAPELRRQVWAGNVRRAEVPVG